MIKRQNISYLVPVTLRSLHYFASPLLLPDYKRSIGGTHMQISLLVCRLKGLVLGSEPCSKSLCRHFSWTDVTSFKSKIKLECPCNNSLSGHSRGLLRLTCLHAASPM